MNQHHPQARQDEERPKREVWHIVKDIPLALLFSITMAVGSGVWYASATNARIMVIETVIEKQSSLREDVVQIREQLRSLERLTIRLEQYLDHRATIDQKSDLQERPQ
jgi:hypothetical protein